MSALGSPCAEAVGSASPTWGRGPHEPGRPGRRRVVCRVHRGGAVPGRYADGSPRRVRGRVVTFMTEAAAGLHSAIIRAVKASAASPR
jgi:hypothetical protein